MILVELRRNRVKEKLHFYQDQNC